MIGPKKLGTIRQELKRSFSATGDDPIIWLEKRIAEAEAKGTGETAVLNSLFRVLKSTGRKKRGAKRVGARN